MCLKTLLFHGSIIIGYYFKLNIFYVFYVMNKDYKKKLVLHVGLPKTSTTSLQTWAINNLELLKKHGVDFPIITHEKSKELINADYQLNILDEALVTGNFTRFYQLLNSATTDKILISSEFLTHKLYNIHPNFLVIFRKILAQYDTTLFLTIREKGSWLKSSWKEHLVSELAFVLTLDEFVTIPLMRRQCDIANLKQDLANAYGVKKIVDAEFEKNWIYVLEKTLDLHNVINLNQSNSMHISVSDDLAELIRQLNCMYPYSCEIRATFFALIQKSCSTQHRVFIGSYDRFAKNISVQKNKLKEIILQFKPQNATQQELCSLFIKNIEHNTNDGDFILNYSAKF